MLPCRSRDESTARQGAPAKEGAADKAKAATPPKKDISSPPSRPKMPPAEYAPKLPVAPLTDRTKDYKSVKDRHVRLYISADFCKVVANWTQVS